MDNSKLVPLLWNALQGLPPPARALPVPSLFSLLLSSLIPSYPILSSPLSSLLSSPLSSLLSSPPIFLLSFSPHSLPPLFPFPLPLRCVNQPTISSSPSPASSCSIETFHNDQCDCNRLAATRVPRPSNMLTRAPPPDLAAETAELRARLAPRMPTLWIWIIADSHSCLSIPARCCRLSSLLFFYPFVVAGVDTPAAGVRRAADESAGGVGQAGGGRAVTMPCGTDCGQDIFAGAPK